MKSIGLLVAGFVILSMLTRVSSGARARPAAPGGGSGLSAVGAAGSVTDIDGNRYRTIAYGKLEWMVENLRTTQLNDGTPIALVTNDAVWANVIGPAMSWYGNEGGGQPGSGYGALYNWNVVSTGKLAPAGWRVPSHQEWTAFLTETLGGTPVTGGQVLMQGKLKSKRTAPDGHPRWNAPNAEATDETGFGALPGGSRNFVGTFDYLGSHGFWWTATSMGGSSLAWYWGMRSDSGHVFMTSGNKRNGFSVRCVRDLP